MIIFCFPLQTYAINVVFRLDDFTLQADSVSLRAVQLFNEKQVPLSIAMVSFDEQEQHILPLIAADRCVVSELCGVFYVTNLTDKCPNESLDARCGGE